MERLLEQRLATESSPAASLAPPPALLLRTPSSSTTPHSFTPSSLTYRCRSYVALSCFSVESKLANRAGREESWGRQEGMECCVTSCKKDC